MRKLSAVHWPLRALKCWFDDKKTEAGRDALGYYHERKDENRDVGLGPEHDWSSTRIGQLRLDGDFL